MSSHEVEQNYKAILKGVDGLIASAKDETCFKIAQTFGLNIAEVRYVVFPHGYHAYSVQEEFRDTFCQFIKSNKAQCQCPAMKDSKWCKRHSKVSV